MKLLIISTLFLVICSQSNSEQLLLKNIDRVIDLTTQLAKVTVKLTFENAGNSPVYYFLHVIDSKLEGNGPVSLFAQSTDSTKASLKVHEPTEEINGRTYKIEFKETLVPSKIITVELEEIWSHRLEPYPHTITQKDKQLVRFIGNHYFYSPYKAVKQTTNVVLNTKNIESYSKLKPISQSTGSLIYGPYEDIVPYSKNLMEIHYENTAAFLTVTYLERVIEVSHWGNIAVEETIELVHTGAILKGPFSRYDYQRESSTGQPSVKSFKTMLPAAAADVYYRDEIGNVSTSHLRPLKDGVELELRPRFPLFGGWRTRYTVGYNVPSYEYLFNSGDRFTLKMRLLDHIFDDMVVDSLVTRVILPEGSLNFQLEIPYPVIREQDSLHFTYLDLNGRPVITLKKNDLVEQHIQDMIIQYDFPKIRMLQEPLSVVAALYALFLLVIIYVRLDFSIAPDESSDARMRVAGHWEKVLVIHDKLRNIYRTFDDKLSKLKTSKDVDSYYNATKGLATEYKNQVNALIALTQKMKTDIPEVFDKMNELQRLDKCLKEVYTQQQNLYTDKLVTGKISRQVFIDTDNAFAKKKEDFFNKISAILKSLE